MKNLKLSLVAVSCLLSVSAVAADHGDTPFLSQIGRNDAKITDLHAFVRGENLVIAVSTNPAIPVGATGFAWSPDVTFTVHIDHKAAISTEDAAATGVYGGVPTNPDDLAGRITFTISAPNGQPQLTTSGVKGVWRSEVQFYAGLRDDPFIRAPRNGRNINAIVIEVPLKGVQHSETQQTMAIWATSQIAGHLNHLDLAGRSLRSMFPENDALNTLTPAEHYTVAGKQPDVVILDASRATAYPNGRALEDDVVDLVGDLRVINSDSPFPTANDRPFLAEFPYLADPH